MFRILLVPGDGVGPSLIESAETVLTVAGDGIEIVHGDLGFNAYERTGEYIPSDTLDLIRECGNVICGPFNPYRDQAGKQVDILDNLKVGLDLYATVRVFQTSETDWSSLFFLFLLNGRIPIQLDWVIHRIPNFANNSAYFTVWKFFEVFNHLLCDVGSDCNVCVHCLFLFCSLFFYYKYRQS